MQPKQCKSDAMGNPMDEIKKKTIRSVVQAGSSDTWESPVIPDGTTVTIKRFGGCDIAHGDGKSSVYLLEFGSEMIYCLSPVGGKEEFKEGESFIGDGQKRFKLTRQNLSSTSKPLPCWIRAYIR